MTSNISCISISLTPTDSHATCALLVECASLRSNEPATMLSRKSKDKAIKEGIVGKYVKIETPPATGENPI